MPAGVRLVREPAVFVLGEDEKAQVTRLIERLLPAFPGRAGIGFLNTIALQSHNLPEKLRAFLLEMRFRESAAAFAVSGYAVDDGSIGPTPHGWGKQPDQLTTSRETIWLALCGSVLGDLFGWATQQDGAMVHDIAPARGDEHSQVGSSSSELLWWHTEEAFHPLKCDYLGLMCLRNPDRVATTFASMTGIELAAEVRKVLFEKRFVIRPDFSHLRQRENQDWPAGKEGELRLAAQQRIDRMNESPERIALLTAALPIHQCRRALTGTGRVLASGLCHSICHSG
jgi:Fe(II)/alpha-ketoglutarate-dependent arginine beta-hydroxylase